MNEDQVTKILKSADPVSRYRLDAQRLDASKSDIEAILAKCDIPFLAKLWRGANRKWKAILAIFAAVLAVSVSGGGVIIARNLLDESWRQSINSLNCDVSADNAHLMRRGSDSIGTTTEYWTVKSEKSVLDVLVQKSSIDGASGGTLSCDHKARLEGVPFVSFSFYALDDKVPHVALYGWIPRGTKGIIDFENGRSIEVTPNINGDVLQLVDFSVEEPVALKNLTIRSSNGRTMRIIDLQMTNG